MTIVDICLTSDAAAYRAAGFGQIYRTGNDWNVRVASDGFSLSRTNGGHLTLHRMARHGFAPQEIVIPDGDWYTVSFEGGL